MNDHVCKCPLYVGPPSSPTITVEDIRLNSSISWTVIPDVNSVCGPVMYNVTFDDDVTNATSMTNVTYSELNHTTNYTVVVVPYNNAGPGTSANITVTTLVPSGQIMCICNNFELMYSYLVYTYVYSY